MSDKLAKQEGGPLVIPDFLKGVSGNEGLEKVRKEDLILPRLGVCQSLSPQRQKNKPNYINGLEEGMIFNNVTEEILTKSFDDKIAFIPLVYTPSRILYKDRKEGGGILCRSFNAIDGGTIAPFCDQCTNSKFHDTTPPLCTYFMNVVCLLLPSKQLAILSFKSKELTITARPWITRMKSRNKPAYAQEYEMSVITASSEKGDFFARKITFKGFVQDEALYNYAKTEYENIRGIKVVAHDEDETETGQESDQDMPF